MARYVIAMEARRRAIAEGGNVVALSPDRPRPARQADGGPRGVVLLFTGVRYERSEA